MTGEIVNFRRARKQKSRADKIAQAAANRAKSGRTKAEREQMASQEQIERRRLDGHVRRPDDDEG